MNRKTFIALFAVVFVAQIGLGIVSPLMPLYGESMGASGLWLGIMFGSFAMSRVIFMPVAGWLSDVRDRKKFITLGLLAYTIISLFYVWAGSIITLTVVRLFHGLASCLVLPVAQAYVGDLIPEGKEGTYINIFSMSLFLGMGCGPILGGALTEYFFMDAAFYGMAAVSSLALFLLLPFVPATEPSSRTDGREKVASVRTIIRDSKVQAASIFRFSRGFWRQGIVAFLPLLAVANLGMTPASVGLVLSAYLLSGGVVQGLVGPLVDRSNKVAIILICGTGAPALLFLIPYLESGGTLLAVLLLTALLGAIGRAVMMAINVERGRKHRGMGTVMGLYSSVSSLGMAAGPIAFGYAMDVFGLESVFIFGAITGVIGSLATTYFLTK